MFTGLIEVTGKVERIETASHGASLLIRPTDWNHTPEHGESIAVNGCCLTVANPPGQPVAGTLRFDVIPQTLRLTTLGGLQPGDVVNLEHSVTPATLLGGHLVQGHVDGVGMARRVETEATEWRLRITPPSDLMDLIIPQGSITIDGVSLTIAQVDGDSFDVTLVPTTLGKTNLRRIGSDQPTRVNLEVDHLVRIVQHLLRRAGTL